MELDMMGIGERIKTRRKELKLSQTDIYERCDITSGALSKIENGKTTPSVIAFYKLSQVLEYELVGNRNIFQYAEVQYLQIGRGAVEWFPGAS